MSPLYFTIVQYLVFSIFLFTGTTILYQTITSREVRKLHRIKLVENIQKSKSTAEEKLTSNGFNAQLRQAGITFLNSFRYETVRFVLLIIYLFYYIIWPPLEGNTVSTTPLIVLFLLAVATEHRLKPPISIINVVINRLIARKRKNRRTELFTLYDILKADLKALQDKQDVNIYALLKSSLPMFRYINGTVSRFLSLWVTNPEKAKDVFYEDIKTPGARTLGEVIVKIDTASRDEALHVIQSESSVFAENYFKTEVKNNQKRKNILMTSFSVNVLVNATWLIALIATMLLIQLNSTMIQ